MANYVLVIDLGDAAEAMQYTVLNQLMHECGFTLRGSETLRPAQFSLTSALSLRRLRQMVADRIKVQLHVNVVVDAYEIRQLLQFDAAPLPHCRSFR
jgi:hypothetical protein